MSSNHAQVRRGIEFVAVVLDRAAQCFHILILARGSTAPPPVSDGTTLGQMPQRSGAS
jgi:hypothetical protein